MKLEAKQRLTATMSLEDAKKATDSAIKKLIDRLWPEAQKTGVSKAEFDDWIDDIRSSTIPNLEAGDDTVEEFNLWCEKTATLKDM